MAETTKKDNKNLIIGICVAAVAIVAIIIAIVLAVKGGSFALNDSFFESDDTKLVYTIPAEQMEFDSDEEKFIPVKAHAVFTYSGEEITGMKYYAEYANEDTAKKAFEALKSYDEEAAKKAEISGKYLIVTADPELYEGLTTSEVKQDIEFKEAHQDEDEEEDLEENTDKEATEEATIEAEEVEE